MRGKRVRSIVLAAVIVAVLGVPGSATGARADAAVDTHGYMDLIGTLHGHSGYSDGWPGSTPATYYASAKGFGLDFMSGSEHSDTARVPVVASEECLVGTVIVSCVGGDPAHPGYALQKWVATSKYARAATTASFVGLRGFEWTSDRFGHINVYFSKHDTNAKIDGGYVSMAPFYSWLLRSPTLGGGSDGLATFNHPGDKSLRDGDAAFNWNDFKYNPAADSRMVGMELYNDHNEYGISHGGTDPAEGYYAHALDKGWHLGAVGAEDLGHRFTDDWGGPGWAKTVILATARTGPAIKAAMAARRFYAVADRTVRLDFTVDGALMGSRLARPVGAALAVHAVANRASSVLELITRHGQVVATSPPGGVLDHVVNATAGGERYYFIRVRDGGTPVAYSSPIWVRGT